MYQFVLLVNKQGKTRLSKWYSVYTNKEKARIIREVSTMVLNRNVRHCNILEWRDSKIIYKRYASLFFIACIDNEENELITLETVHHYVEVLDRYFGNVCELDLIYEFHKAYFILDELLMAGELQESSKRSILRSVSQQDVLQDNPNDNRAEL
ncbi:AP-1 complex subunit sigma-2 [Balamuthia mandrillaris]